MYLSCYSGARWSCGDVSALAEPLFVFPMDGTPVQHNQPSRQTKRAGGDLPRGGMALPSNMLTLQKGEIWYMGRILGCGL